MEHPDGPARPDGRPAGGVDDDLVEALVYELSDGDGTTDAFGRDEWVQYAQAVLLHLGIDMDDVAIVASDDGAEIVPQSDLLDLNERRASAASIASQYLRRVAEYAPERIGAMDDDALIAAFLRETTELPDGLTVGEP